MPWFGAMVGGDGWLVAVLDMDLGRALLAGRQQFTPGEEITARAVVDEAHEKGTLCSSTCSTSTTTTVSGC